VGRLEGKVAFITGAARGQGRAHAVRMAEEGADIIAMDICAPVAEMPFPLGTEEDLAETVAQVETLDRRIVARKGDVRDSAALDAAVSAGVAEFGRLDIVVANAGLSSLEETLSLSDAAWQTVIDVNLTGVWRTCKATVPAMIKAGNGGSIIMTSSAAGLRAYPNIGHYVASKHGVIGLMKTLAIELAPHGIRVNTVNPSNVNTPLLVNDYTMRRFAPATEGAVGTDGELGAEGYAEFERVMKTMHVLPIPFLEPVDIANGAVFLASNEARYVTGICLPLDAGNLLL
jgi:(+)-trans-carveol dehydrogenase